MFPVVHALRETRRVRTRLVVTGQHRELLDQVLGMADLVPDIDLDLMQRGQPLDALTARLVTRLGIVFDAERPARILVHGDTLTTLAATLAAYFRKIPVGHVEAGLRSGDIYRPWPEEANRRIAGIVADMHFAPTRAAREALIRENVAPANIHVTGNTIVDALHCVSRMIEQRPELASGLDGLVSRFKGKRIIAVTVHRRENLGRPLADISRAIADIAARPDVAMIVPVHPNPGIRPVLEGALANHANVALVPSLDYPHFVRLLQISALVLTDSGGVQEEAPALGKPVLVMRGTTERPEGIAAGTARLVGACRESIVAEAARLLDDPVAHAAMARAHNPYGDGRAAGRIATLVADRLAGR